MKRLILIAVMLWCNVSNAQVGVASFNISRQPIWGPVGYDYVNYYFIPEIDAYYNVPTHQFTWMRDGKWVTTNTLPVKYADMDLYAAHKVVLDNNEPWLHDEQYKARYGHFAGQHDQQAIRDSHEEKYWENPGHPEHKKWRKSESPRQAN